MKKVIEYDDINEMIGKTIVKIVNVNDDCLYFYLENGDYYMFLHKDDDDCHGDVRIESICGSLHNILNSPLTVAKATYSCGLTDDIDNFLPDWKQETCTWSFYKFATDKGCITVRWFGTSTNYECSEKVTCVKVAQNLDNEPE